MYIASFSAGMGAMPWVVMSEVNTNHIRSKKAT